MALVTDIKKRPAGTRRRVVALDGDDWRATSADVIADLGLRVGHIEPLADLSEAIDSAEPALARAKALRLLNYRERSVSELVGRLIGDGYPDPLARSVAGDLEASGLVDDERFAHALARQLIEIRGFGRRRALSDLAAKGVDDRIAAAAVDEFASPQDDERRAEEMARQLAPRLRGDVDRIASKLVRKGFPTGVALRAARDAADAMAQIDDPSYLQESGDPPF
jgi:regulatory protein